MGWETREGVGQTCWENEEGLRWIRRAPTEHVPTIYSHLIWGTLACMYLQARDYKLERVARSCFRDIATTLQYEAIPLSYVMPVMKVNTQILCLQDANYNKVRRCSLKTPTRPTGAWPQGTRLNGAPLGGDEYKERPQKQTDFSSLANNGKCTGCLEDRFPLAQRSQILFSHPVTSYVPFSGE